ncbi:MAG: histidinol dehydrogenase [Candidatus Verstraetearchaeota archaeon]|nr:histidinol dehydrogenase [Candidatus Verstraetearchaeota archaeon]
MKILTYKEYKSEIFKEIPNEIFEVVNKIIKDVKEKGDKAIIEYTEKFDGISLTKDEIKVSIEEAKNAYESMSDELKISLKNSIERIKKFQEAQLPKSFSMEITKGVIIGVKYTPISSVGIYVPGGRKAYISTVLMASIPAKVAGVKRCIISTPPRFSRDIAAIAYMLGINEVYRVGGAQAIAAMAYGTETIKKVEKIVGPGNIYVTVAKILVSKDVAVDMPAGPSEILIYADYIKNHKWIAMDILAQAEHDPKAKLILVTKDKEGALKVKEYLKDYNLENAFIILVDKKEEAINLINEIAPEHLEIISNEEIEIENAGAIFIGEYSPVAIGDYTVGTNHILPTMGWAKRSSPLSVRDFIKSIEFVKCTKEGLYSIGKDGIIMAKAEGMEYHAKSIEIRIEENNSS